MNALIVLRLFLRVEALICVSRLIDKLTYHGIIYHLPEMSPFEMKYFVKS